MEVIGYIILFLIVFFILKWLFKHLAPQRVAPQRVAPQLQLPNPTNSLDLSSECPGINYQKLRDLLAAKQWQEADWETTERILEVMGRKEGQWVRVQDIEQFPSKDLKIIDKLWVRYSQGKFGFSVQKKIWKQCGSPTFEDWLDWRIDKKNWEQFGDRVGWRSEGSWLFRLFYPDIYEKEKEGGLPRCLWCPMGNGCNWLEDLSGLIERWFSLFSREDL